MHPSSVGVHCNSTRQSCVPAATADVADASRASAATSLVQCCYKVENSEKINKHKRGLIKFYSRAGPKRAWIWLKYAGHPPEFSLLQLPQQIDAAAAAHCASECRSKAEPGCLNCDRNHLTLLNCFLGRLVGPLLCECTHYSLDGDDFNEVC